MACSSAEVDPGVCIRYARQRHACKRCYGTKVKCSLPGEASGAVVVKIEGAGLKAKSRGKGKGKGKAKRTASLVPSSDDEAPATKKGTRPLAPLLTLAYLSRFS